MGRKLQKIFNECVERILQGESIEACLRSYPKNAAELEPMLKATVTLQRREASFDPRPEFKALARARIEGAQLYAQQQSQKRGFSTWQRAWVPALASVCILLFAMVGTVAASSGALPDKTLYPVKQATENIRLALTFTDTGKAKLHADLAENRSEEIVAMAAQGNTEQVIVLTERLATNLIEAQEAITRIEQAESKQQKTTPAVVPAAEPPPPPPEPTLTPSPSQDEDTRTADTAEPETTQPTTSEAVDTELTEPAEPEAVETESTEPAEPEAVETESTESTKVSKLKKSFDNSLSKNLEILEGALDQAPEKVKPALEQAIEVSKKSYWHKRHQGNGDDNGNQEQPTSSTTEEHQANGDDSLNNLQPTDENTDDAGQQGTKNGKNDNPTPAKSEKDTTTAPIATDNSTGKKNSSTQGK